MRLELLKEVERMKVSGVVAMALFTKLSFLTTSGEFWCVRGCGLHL